MKLFYSPDIPAIIAFIVFEAVIKITFAWMYSFDQSQNIIFMYVLTTLLVVRLLASHIIAERSVTKMVNAISDEDFEKLKNVFIEIKNKTNDKDENGKEK